jgi:hypothetical protein
MRSPQYEVPPVRDRQTAHSCQESTILVNELRRLRTVALAIGFTVHEKTGSRIKAHLPV